MKKELTIWEKFIKKFRRSTECTDLIEFFKSGLLEEIEEMDKQNPCKNKKGFPIVPNHGVYTQTLSDLKERLKLVD